MNAEKTQSYEVHVRNESGWTISSTFTTEEDALEHIDKVSYNPKYEAARVVYEKMLPSGYPVEKVLHEKKFHKSSDIPLTIVPTKEAFSCRNTRDLFKYQGRMTIGNILRNYCNKYCLTAAEILYNADNYQNLRMLDDYCNHAIVHIGEIQAKRSEQDKQTRINELYNIIDDIPTWQEISDGLEEYRQMFAQQGFAPVFKTIRDSLHENMRDFALGAILANHMGTEREWPLKLGLLLELTHDESLPAEAVHILDEFCAELLANPQAFDEVVGGRADMYASLDVILSVYNNEYKPQKIDKPCLEQLAKTLSKWEMPFTRQVIEKRLTNFVSSVKPLTRDNEDIEKQAFTNLLTQLFKPARLIGGSRMAEAITLRAKPFFSQTPDQVDIAPTINGIMDHIQERLHRFCYPIELRNTKTGKRYNDLVENTISQSLENVQTIDDLVSENIPQSSVVTTLLELSDTIPDIPIKPALRYELALKVEELLSPSDTKRSKPRNKPNPQSSKNEEMGGRKVNADGGFSRRIFEPGEIIFRQGDIGREAYLIASGAVQIIRKNDNGVLELLATLQRGSIFGEMAIIDDEPRMATARAGNETILTIIPQTAFRQRLSKLEEVDPVIRRLIDVFVNRIRELADRPPPKQKKISSKRKPRIYR